MKHFLFYFLESCDTCLQDNNFEEDIYKSQSLEDKTEHYVGMILSGRCEHTENASVTRVNIFITLLILCNVYPYFPLF